MTIRFNSKIYKEKAIKDSIGDFAGLALFSMKKERGYFVVEIKGENKNTEENLKNEFFNYALAKTIG
jgi:hypothetical protein